MSLPQILVIDPDGEHAKTLAQAFSHQATVTSVESVEAAKQELTSTGPAVIVCRDDLPAETGIMFFSRVAKNPLWQRRILICPELNSDLTLFLINDTQIFRCLHHPLEPGILVQAVETAIQESRRIRQLVAAEEENVSLKRELAATRPPLAQRTTHWFQTLPRLVAVVLFSFAGIFTLGVVTLLALYLLKTLLGIDLIPGAHLSDVLPE